MHASAVDYIWAPAPIKRLDRRGSRSYRDLSTSFSRRCARQHESRRTKRKGARRRPFAQAGSAFRPCGGTAGSRGRRAERASTLEARADAHGSPKAGGQGREAKATQAGRAAQARARVEGRAQEHEHRRPGRASSARRRGGRSRGARPKRERPQRATTAARATVAGLKRSSSPQYSASFCASPACKWTPRRAASFFSRARATGLGHGR